MATSEALSSFGTILQIGDGATPEVFTGIAEVRDIDGPGLTLGTVEVTHHLSPNAYKEYQATLKDLEDISFELGFIPTEATHDLTTGLMAKLDDRTRTNFRMVFTDSTTTWGLTGFVTSFKITAQLENVYLANCSIKLTGGITVI